MSTQPTPLPWHIRREPFAIKGEDIGIYAAVFDAEDKGIALICQSALGNDGPNAEFIARACNSHDDLLTALKELHDAALKHCEAIEEVMLPLCKAQDAIAKARKEE